MFDIVVPIYNVEKYLDKCLESIKNNKRPEDRVILIDDGSIDNSPKIAQSYIAKNWTYIKKENGGLSSARNEAVPYLQSDYLVFLDSDDYLEEGCLDRVREEIALRNYPDVILTRSKIVYDDASTQVIGFKYDSVNADNIHECPPAAWDKIYRVEYFLKLGFLFPVGRLYEDLPTTFPLLLASKNIIVSDAVMVNWFQRNESISRSKQFKLGYFDVFENLTLLTERLNIIGCNDRDAIINTVFYKKVLLDTLIRWNRAGRNLSVLKAVIVKSSQNASVRSLFKSKLKLRIKIVLFPVVVLIKTYAFSSKFSIRT
ncbi:putative glycosyltransferase EpsJ [Thalassocella blandensis]|nr:putative glycosyltransferase EpsJ [Thalassocella blandensis]